MGIELKTQTTRRKAIIGVMLLVCAYLAYDLSRDGRPEVQKVFDERVQALLTQPGDTVAVSELNRGDWSEVCWLDDSVSAEDFTVYKFHIQRDNVKFINDTVDPYQWTPRFLFFYSPIGNVEILTAPKPFRVGMTGETCSKRGEAKFTVIHRELKFKNKDLIGDVLKLTK
jgi:hypothetical protein